MTRNDILDELQKISTVLMTSKHRSLRIAALTINSLILVLSTYDEI